MNTLVFDETAAQAIMSTPQTGQHRLCPCPLSDGRRFLPSDVLSWPPFAAILDGLDYQIVPFEDIAGLIPQLGEE
jgi:hypothetical protein